MKKIILIPDSFKSTMSSQRICGIMEQAIRVHFANANILKVPVADGGEGSVDAFLTAVGGEKRSVMVKGPYFDDIEAFYGIIDGGETAVIEMAACAGLPLVGDNRNPLMTTTYGVGQLIAHALSDGCKKIIMGLGGSATNEAGCGAAAALGVRFSDKSGKEFVPVGGTLSEIAQIDTANINPALKNVDIITMCDIDNPLHGKSGAAYIFGPQKGASPEMVSELDYGLRHLAEVVKNELVIDAADMPGAGAAGGMGYGMNVFFGSKLQMGIETVLNTVRFDELLNGADVVFSGEGKIDTQSLRGKVVIGVARRTKEANVPLIAVVGDIGDNIEEAYEMGVSAIFSINRVAVDFETAKTRAESDLYLTMDNIMRLFSLSE